MTLSIRGKTSLGKRKRSLIPNIIRQAQDSCKRRQIVDFREDLETVKLDGSIKEDAPKEDFDPLWHQNDRYVRRIDPQEFKNFVESPGTFRGPFDTSIDSSDPNCPIHPLFRGLGPTAARLPPFAAALRLATRFLLCRHTLSFFHQLITYPFDLLTPESQFYRVIQRHMPASPYAFTGLPQAEHNLTIQVLVAASQHISIVVVPSETINEKWAYTGTNVQMNLSPHFLAVLHPDTYPRPTDRERLRASFFLAITLVHELTHAVYMLRVPKSAAFANLADSTAMSPNDCSIDEEYEPFYSTQRMAELGHALETSIFRTLLPPSPCNQNDPYTVQLSLSPEQGGKISSLANLHTFSLGLGWSRWPSADDNFFIPNLNPRSNQPIPLARLTRSISTNTIIPRQAPRWRTLYILPDWWLARFFHASFWENSDTPDVASGGGIGLGSGAFVPPRELGVRCENFDWREEDVGVDEGGMEYGGWGAECESVGRGAEEDEGGDGQDEQGVVRSGQPWRGFGLAVDDEDDDDDDDG